MWSNSTVRST